jgi:Mor family transcriptional regulator
MEDLRRANVMERVLRDKHAEGNSVATLAKKFDLSEENIRTVLGIRVEEPKRLPPSKSLIARFREKCGF